MGGRKKCTAGAAAFLPVTPQLQTSGWCSANLSALCHVWTAPAVQEEFDVSAMVGCGHVFGLSLQPLWPLAMM